MSGTPLLTAPGRMCVQTPSVAFARIRSLHRCGIRHGDIPMVPGSRCGVHCLAARDGAKRGKGGGRGRRGKGGRGKKGKAAVLKPQVPMTAPLSIETTNELSGYEPYSQGGGRPWWSTFVATNEGVWHGETIAVSPGTGECEPVAIDEDRNKVDVLYTNIEETRDVDVDDNPCLLRRIARGTNQAQVAAGDAVAHDESIEEVRIFDEDDGAGTFTVIFDGASYARAALRVVDTPEEVDAALAIDQAGQGEWVEDAADEAQDDEDDPDAPVRLAPEDVEADAPGAPPRMATVEHCINYGGDRRCRLEMLLAGRGGYGAELDVEVLRVSVHHERWMGPDAPMAASKAASLPASEDVGQLPLLSRRDRLQPKALRGAWKVLEQSGAPIPDTLDPATGTYRTMAAYTTREVEQTWKPASNKFDAAGATYWLPDGVAVTVEMIPSDAASFDEPEALSLFADDGSAASTYSMDAAWPPTRLAISTCWAVKEGSMMKMSTKYDEDGKLYDVVLDSAVQGGWVGGSM